VVVVAVGRVVGVVAVVELVPAVVVVVPGHVVDVTDDDGAGGVVVGAVVVGAVVAPVVVLVAAVVVVTGQGFQRGWWSHSWRRWPGGVCGGVATAASDTARSSVVSPASHLTCPLC
jgi:hypothetical protein